MNRRTAEATETAGRAPARDGDGGARIDEYIARTLAAAPPMSQEQRERLALLFTPATSGGVAA